MPPDPAGRSAVPDGSLADARDGDARIADLLDEYLAAARAGAPPDAEEFLAAHPDVADRLRVALVGFDFVRRAGEELVAVSDDPTAARETLGDFRILREVGR